MVAKGHIAHYFHLKQDKLLVFFFGGLIFLIISLLSCLLWLKHLNYSQMQISNQRYESYRIANLLRRTSDDLTTMSRLYVVTKNQKYLDYFNEILSIRNGASPRPERYDEVYWDLVKDGKRPRPFGKALSLDHMMIHQGFSLEEFNLLKQSQEASNNLSKIERKAINIVSGETDADDDSSMLQNKADQQYAINLLFSKNYMDQKAKIMQPIQLLIEEVTERTDDMYKKIAHETSQLISIAIALTILSTIVIVISIGKAMRRIAITANENELLILNMFPQSIMQRLKRGEEIIADEYPQASVLFCDLVDFTSMTQTIGMVKMFDILGHLFDELDTLTQTYGVEKIKTIGDSYMAASGVPEPAADHAIRMADFALSINTVVQKISQTYQLKLQTRIGMTYGSVIAGVIGHKKFIYDVWGDVVNTASRIENTCTPGKIHITEKMAFLLEDLFIIEGNKTFDIKGKGKMNTYFLIGRREFTKLSNNND